ncbi:MAG: ATP-binding cassette domain-containing protein, partial [Arenicellales bacterium]|nr:ATP-binding cassette domain-containing protein [Arenicellales bacterium]
MNNTQDTPALQVEDMHKSFGAVEVLRGVSLVAKTGDVISMLGASGSGKSTLLRCINLLETPNSGKITVHGELIQMTTDRQGDPVPADIKQVARIRSQ